MIDLGFKLKPALLSMWDDTSVLERLKVSALKWEILTFLSQFLKSFEYVTNFLSPEKESTLPVVVVAINTLLDRIENILSQ